MRANFFRLSFLLCTSTFAQTVQNVTAAFVDNKVIISYDLKGGPSGQIYKVELFCSKDNYQAPMVNAEGDLRNILAGTGKRIILNAEVEFKDIDQLLMFKVRARYAGLPITIKKPTKNEVMKLGKATNITWDGGEPSETLKLELVQNTSIIHVVGNPENKGSFTWTVPKTLKKGTYSVRISSAASVAESSPFIIKKKTPVWIFIAPVAVIGSVVALLGGGGGGNTGGTDLPGAPGPK